MNTRQALDIAEAAVSESTHNQDVREQAIAVLRASVNAATTRLAARVTHAEMAEATARKARDTASAEWGPDRETTKIAERRLAAASARVEEARAAHKLIHGVFNAQR